MYDSFPIKLFTAVPFASPCKSGFLEFWNLKLSNVKWTYEIKTNASILEMANRRVKQNEIWDS